MWTAYLAPSAPQSCIGSCHKHQFEGATTAKGTYSWLNGRGYIGGASSALCDPSQSCLTWLGGNMPPGGSYSLPAAVTACNSWAAAGALNN
jgi:hypothetical protein